MASLSPGANAPVASAVLTVSVGHAVLPSADIDVSAFALSPSGKVRSDADMCFYGQTSVCDGAIRIAQAVPGRTEFTLDLERLDASVEKVALTATIHENKASFASVSSLEVRVGNELEAAIPTAGMQETALILGEFYRRQGAWKFRCVAQGFTGGLAPLASHFGVDVESPASAPSVAPAPAPAPAPVPSATVSLSKVTLDKSRGSISLEKKSGDFGEIKVNLNWNRGNAGGGGFFSFAKSQSIDLDLGCLFELQDGHKGVVQALGESFGSFRDEPFIQLMGDDRTGAVSDGEWMRINGQQWKEIRRILVFAFIYQGAPNWKATDGVVTIFVPDQPPIEVRLSEEGGRQGMCAIALLENDKGAVKVSRRVDFHRGHPDMDKAYGWGMRWQAGSK